MTTEPITASVEDIAQTLHEERKRRLASGEKPGTLQVLRDLRQQYVMSQRKEADVITYYVSNDKFR